MIVDKIKDKLNKESWIVILNKLGAKKINDNGNELRSQCVIHKGDNDSAFVVNLETNLWFCFTRCLIGGDLFDLIDAIYKPPTFKANIIMCCDLLGLSFSNEELNSVIERDMKEQREFVQHMVNQTKKKQNNPYNLELLGTHRTINNYRGFESSILNSYEITYIEELKRVCFPVKDETGMVVGASCRAVGNEKPKWKHYPANISTGLLLWGIDNIDTTYDICFLVEGIIDVMKLRELGIQNVVCTFGANITKHQIELLIKKGITNIILMYDNDEAGRKATEKFIDKYRYLFNVKVADLESLGVKDPGEIQSTEQLCEVPHRNWYIWIHRNDE